MTDPASPHASLPDAVFLQRMADGSGQAAFIVLRLVDLLGPEHATLHPDAFHYQYVATARCCRELPPGATETSHLLGLVRSTADAFRQQSAGLVLPALFAYAHYLAVVLSTGGRPAEAIPHEWRAFQLYEDGLAQMRVLSDLGIMLLTVGDVAAAERALTEIVRRGASHDVVDNAMIELMHCASF